MNDYEKHLLLTCLEKIELHGRRQEFLIGKIMTKLSELAPKLEALNGQLVKASAEIVAQVTALQNALTEVALSPEAEAALQALADQAAALDAMNADELTEPLPEVPAPTEEPQA